MFRLILGLISLALLCAIANAASCKTFKCGSIQQQYEDENRTCVERQNENSYYAEGCTPGYQCTAASWNAVDQAKNNSTCQAINPDSRPNNTVLPGDFCSNDTQCFNHDNNVTCIENKCNTTYTDQSECPDNGSEPGHRYCPERYYCKSKKCTPALGLGDTCADGEECKFGLACIATDEPNYTNFTCQSYNSLDVNKTFDISKLTYPADNYLGKYNLCKTNHAIELQDQTKYNCRKGDTSNINSLSDLKRDDTGDNCTYTSYDQLENPDNGTEKVDNPECGFNKGSNPYCIMRKGDKWFTDAYDKIAKIDLSSYSCHVESKIEDCVDAIKKMDNDTVKDYNKVIKEVDPDYGYFLIADNDNCIAKAITVGFWAGDEPGFAINIGISSVFFIFLSISILFY